MQISRVPLPAVSRALIPTRAYHGTAGTITFGSGSNTFGMTFVDIGNAGNATDTTGDPNPAGAVGWNEAARFTNWLNTSTGGFAAYNFAGATGVNDPIVTQAGGLSPYGIMGLGGNVWECEETSNDLNESSSSSVRGVRGGNWDGDSYVLSSSVRSSDSPAGENGSVSFRVASLSSSASVP